jgi:hypothetical protein
VLYRCVDLLLCLLLPRYSHNYGNLLGLIIKIKQYQHQGNMFARMMVEDRFLGFDAGDWTMLFGGMILAALVALLV